MMLKETVSTTTTDKITNKKKVSIADFKLGKIVGEGKFSKVYIAQYFSIYIDISKVE